MGRLPGFDRASDPVDPGSIPGSRGRAKEKIEPWILDLPFLEGERDVVVVERRRWREKERWRGRTTKERIQTHADGSEDVRGRKEERPVRRKEGRKVDGTVGKG